jgi:hypothetical protein
LPKESNQTPKGFGRGKSSIGTGLSSTLLSSQRTTTHRKTHRRSLRRAPGALVQLYPRYFAPSNRSAFREGSHCNARDRGPRHFRGVRQDGRCGSLRRSSVSLPARRTLPGRLRVAKSGPPQGFRRPHRPVLPPRSTTSSMAGVFPLRRPDFGGSRDLRRPVGGAGRKVRGRERQRQTARC